MVCAWVEKLIEDGTISVEKDLETKPQFLAKIFTYGSYRLEVNSPNSDIDCVLVVVEPISRSKHFFSILYDMLNQNSNVKNLIKIESAWVPVIKMIFHGIQIDLTFCQFKGDHTSLEGITDEDFQNQENINHLSRHSERSLNGRNVTEWILNYFSDPQKLQIFRDTLRCIKLFAL